MGARNNQKKNIDKARNAGKAQQKGKRPIVSPIAVVRAAAPTTPIPALVTLTARPVLKTVRGGTRTLKKWCFDRTPVYRAPEEPWPSISLNKGAVVELTGQNQNITIDSAKITWLEVAYETYDSRAGTQWVTGWVNDAYLDEYNECFPDPGVVIPNQTPDPRDAQQYMLWEGTVRYNLCGEFCVAFIVGDDIDSVLAKWKAKSPASYNAALGGGRDNGTRADELQKMLNAILSDYGYGSDVDQVINLSSKLTYPVTPAGLLEDLKNMLTTHYLIGGVTINDAGQLIGKENPRIKHWIVVDKITRNGNRVEIYNSFPNRREECSFSEFYSSFSTNSGLWVKRKGPRASSSVENLPVFEVKIEKPNPLYRAAQFIDVDGAKKTNLCGEFCVAFILNESIESVLKCWKEVQPILYADTVGNNKGTGTFTLGTIFKAYGYNTEGDFVEFSNGLIDPFLRKSIPSPDRIAKKLGTHYLIAGVNIDGVTGQLKLGDKVRHWVVIDKLTPLGKNRGWVEIYNPFFNRWEEYSYKHFIDAAGYWSGLWVKREIVPVYVDQVVQSARTEDTARKDHRIGQWTEEQVVAAIRRKSGTGKSVNKVAEQLAEQSGWKKKDIVSLLKKMARAGDTWFWTEAKLRAEMQKRLEAGKPVSKITAELAKQSGWKKRDVIILMKKLIASQKWAEAHLLAVLKEKRKTIKSTNKIVADLAKRSGWKRHEILSRLKNLIAAEKWSESQLWAEMKNYLARGNPASKVAAELMKRSGWKKREVIPLMKKLIASQKWTEEQLLAVMKEKRKTIKSTNKIVAELVKQSGWKKHETLKRLKDLIAAEKWIEPHLRAEVEKRLEFGTSVTRISNQLADLSGWKKWEISRIAKKIKEEEKARAGKKHVKIMEEPVIVVDPSTIIHASKHWKDFVKWQDSLLAQNPKLRRVRKWGEDIMVKYGFDVNQINSSNFQAVGLYNNGTKEFGAITSFIRISHAEVMSLKALQIEDNYVAKRQDWRSQKMNWLCKFRGTIYFFDETSDEWPTASQIRWGTLALGGNLVQVLGTEMIEAKFRDGAIHKAEMACLQGFRLSDWGRPLDELLAEGLVHRCFCAYKSNHFGDSPKGIVYSPFFSVANRDFAGLAQPTALYIPVEWLEPKRL